MAASDWDLNLCYLLFRFIDNRPSTLDNQILPGFQLIQYGNDVEYFLHCIQNLYRKNCLQICCGRNKKYKFI